MKQILLYILLFVPMALVAQGQTAKPKTIGAPKNTVQETAKPDTTAKIIADSVPSSMPAPENNPPAAESAPEVIITGHEKKGIVDSTVIRAAIDHYYNTRLEGFQQSGLPRFIITGRERKFLLGIGGFVNFRTSFDFAGAIDNRDFITYDIPVPSSEASRQRFGMDASSSRLFFKAIANSKSLGQVVSYIETDFRGQGSGGMRMRYAYIEFGNFLFGRSVTTFCDLGAAPTTVDAEGPNAYNYIFNEMFRYSWTLPNKKWKVVASIEAPLLSATENERMQSIPQRLPDIPVYVQYEWANKRGEQNHVRLSTILRELRYYDSDQDQAMSHAGFGIQFTTSVRLPHNFTFFAQSLYGKGVARYIQDIAGHELDLVLDPRHDDRMQTLKMAGWFTALQYTLSSQIFLCAGYSQVEVFRPDYYPKDDTYLRAQYFFSNLFINIGSSCTIGLEYINGTRRNMNGQSAHANRIQGMIQYNF